MIREALRTETGLRLSQGDGGRVPVRTVEGLPLPFRRIVDAEWDSALWELYLRQALFETTADGLRVLVERFENLVSTPSELQGQREGAARVRNLIVGLLSRLQKSDVPRQIWNSRKIRSAPTSFGSRKSTSIGW